MRAAVSTSQLDRVVACLIGQADVSLHKEIETKLNAQAVKPRLDRAIECRLAEVVQPSGSLVIVREPSALTLIVPAPARFSCS